MTVFHLRNNHKSNNLIKTNRNTVSIQFNFALILWYSLETIRYAIYQYIVASLLWILVYKNMLYVFHVVNSEPSLVWSHWKWIVKQTRRMVCVCVCVPVPVHMYICIYSICYVHPSEICTLTLVIWCTLTTDSGEIGKPAKKEDVHVPAKNIGELQLQEKVSVLVMCLDIETSLETLYNETGLHTYMYYWIMHMRFKLQMMHPHFSWQAHP